MSPSLLDRILRRPAGGFVRAARKRGVRNRVARILESAACEVSPGEPEKVLESRELFEKAAMQAVIGDAGNLELSFGLVDVLATTVETLGLARSCDVPDPFRRVWVSNEEGTRKRGVVLTHRGGEIAVFCPPGGDPLSDAGSVLHLHYRGFSSPVQYDLLLNDTVRLPDALVLHLTRVDGQGTIGRDTQRHEVHLQARVRAIHSDEGGGEEQFSPCEVLDISSGGLRMVCPTIHAKGSEVWIEVPLPDDSEEPFTARAVICWIRDDAQGQTGQGLLFTNLPQPAADRLGRFLGELALERVEGISPSARSEPTRTIPLADRQE